MKAVIIAGGTGSRLYPVTKVINKHLLPVYDKPMVYYPIASAIKAGLKDIIIVSGKDHLDSFKVLLDSENQFKGINFSYVAQSGAGGIAQALGCCKDLAGDEKILAILGDNIFSDDFSLAINNFENSGQSAQVFLKEVANPNRYAVAIFKDQTLIDIQEKPLSSNSVYAVTGIYMYDPRVWQVIEGLQPSNRGELEITDVNNFFLKRGQLDYEILNGEWFDIDSYTTLLQANLYLTSKQIN